MGEEIKSTLEIALEKAERFGKATREELEWERQKEKVLILVGKFLKGEIESPFSELKEFLKTQSKDSHKRLLALAVETLLKNIALPRDEFHLKEIQRTLGALKDAFKNIPQVDQLFNEFEKLLKDYQAHKKAIYQELLKRFSSGISALEKAVSEQLGAKVKLAPESHPQFQEEWNKIKEQLDKEYGRQIDYFKALLLKIVS